MRRTDRVAAPTPAQPEVTFSPLAAAIMMGISRETVYRWVNRGVLPRLLESNKQGRPSYRIPFSAVEAKIKQGILEELPRGAVRPLRSASPLAPLRYQTESAPILRAQLECAQGIGREAAERIRRAGSVPWYRPGLRRQRDAEAHAAIHLLGVLFGVERSAVKADDDPPATAYCARPVLKVGAPQGGLSTPIERPP